MKNALINLGVTVLTPELLPFIPHFPHRDDLVILVYILYPSPFLPSCLQHVQGRACVNIEFPLWYFPLLRKHLSAITCDVFLPFPAFASIVSVLSQHLYGRN